MPVFRLRFPPLLAVVSVLSGLLVASSALADASVTVQLKAKDGAVVDGAVELKKGENVYRCRTQGGKCEIQGVPGGMYSVEVKIDGKPSPKPKQVMIAPTGQVTLVVNAS